MEKRIEPLKIRTTPRRGEQFMYLITQLVLLLTLLLPIANTATAETLRLDEGIPTGMLSRIFPIRTPEKTGTCFVIGVDERQYLVTARHIVSKIKAGDTVEIFFQDAWHPMVINPIFPENEKIDAAALAPDLVITKKDDMPDLMITGRLDIPVGSDGIVLGQKVFFLGFPFNLASRSKDKNDFIPFVKAGILSAIDDRNNDTPIVYIDGHNNPGFSGGPIIFPNLYKGRQLQIAAVVSGYRTQPVGVVEVVVPDEPTSENTTKKLQIVPENSGIIVAYQLNELVEAIKKDPQGLKHATEEKH